MHKIYRLNSGILINVACVTREEYERTSEFTSRKKTWNDHLVSNGLTDPNTVNMNEVSKVLFKYSHDLDDTIIYIENEASICLAKACMALEKSGPDHAPKFAFRIDKYRNMLNLIEKIKLNFIALGRHSLYGTKE